MPGLTRQQQLAGPVQIAKEHGLCLTSNCQGDWSKGQKAPLSKMGVKDNMDSRAPVQTGKIEFN